MGPDEVESRVRYSIKTFYKAVGIMPNVLLVNEYSFHVLQMSCAYFIENGNTLTPTFMGIVVKVIKDKGGEFSCQAGFIL